MTNKFEKTPQRNTHDRSEAPRAPTIPSAANQGNIVDNPESPNESGGPKGPEPTRFGDWENNGRCTDF